MKEWHIGISAAAAAAAGVVAWGAVAASSQLFGPTLRHTSTSRRIALTFDDGPNPAATLALLDLLDRYSARCTFFLIGKYARAYPEIALEISARGHLIGNHTETHSSLFWHTPAGIREELARCQEAITTATRADAPVWMRPPFGYRNPWMDAEAQRMGFKGVVMWSRKCWDWKPQPPQRLIERLGHVARPERPLGDIVLLHDGDHRALNADRRHVLAALEHWLPRWRDAGMEFVTMESQDAAGIEPLQPPASV